MRVSVDTSLSGMAGYLWAGARANMIDAQASPFLLAELYRTVRDPSAARYAPDEVASPFHADEWAEFDVLWKRWHKLDPNEIDEHFEDHPMVGGNEGAFVRHLDRTRAGQSIRADCEDLTMIHGAAFCLSGRDDVEVCITQPRPGAMAHAYLRIGGRVWDPSVYHGMRKPNPKFYETGERACLPLQRPER